MDIKSVSAVPIVAQTATPPPVAATPDRQAGSNALGPAVTLALGKDGATPAGEPAQQAADRPIYTRDAESKSLVFQVVDAASGDVVIQIPNAVVLRARAYEASEGVASRPGAALQKQA